MPLAGFIDLKGASVPLADVLRSEHDMVGEFSLPYPLLAAVAEQSSAPHFFLSVTSLIYCMRQGWIKAKYDYYIKPETMLQATYGTGLHGVIESSKLNQWHKEIHLSYTTPDGIEIQGTCDAAFELPDGTWHVVDFKFPGTPKVTNEMSNSQAVDKIPQYVKQIRAYVAMFPQPVSKASILMMPTCANKLDESFFTVAVSINKKSLDLVMKDLSEKAKILKNCFYNNIPPPASPGWNGKCSELFCPKSVQVICQKINQEQYEDRDYSEE